MCHVFTLGAIKICLSRSYDFISAWDSRLNAKLACHQKADINVWFPRLTEIRSSQKHFIAVGPSNSLSSRTCFPGSTLHTWNKHPQISLPALQKSSLRWNMPLILFREGRLFFEVADRCKESRLTSYSDLVCSVIFKHPPGINGFRFGLTL